MIYAAKIAKTDSAITIGGYSNHPLCPVLGFKTQAEFDAKQSELWDSVDRFTGKNLVRVTRKWVAGYFGSRFQVASDGRVCSECSIDDYEEIRAQNEDEEAMFAADPVVFA